MNARVFFRLVRLGFVEVLRHPLARVVLALALVAFGLYTYAMLDGLRALQDSPHARFAAELLVQDGFAVLARFLWGLQLLLAVPLFAGERFTGALDTFWVRPVPRGLFLLARTLGRSLYFPLFVALYLLGAAFALVQHRLPLAPLAGPLVRHGIFDWLAVLVGMLLLLAFACLSSSRFLHALYWLLAYFAHLQLQVFVAHPSPSPLVDKAARMLAAAWAAAVAGASEPWLDTYYFGPWHLVRLLLSLAVGLATNAMLVWYLAQRAEVFHD